MYLRRIYSVYTLYILTFTINILCFLVYFVLKKAVYLAQQYNVSTTEVLNLLTVL